MFSNNKTHIPNTPLIGKNIQTPYASSLTNDLNKCIKIDQMDQIGHNWLELD